MTTQRPSRSTLEQTYRSADYRVGESLALRLAIDRPEPLLDELLQQYGATSAVLLTAANPGNQLREATGNELALQQLRKQLADAAIRTLPACGRDPLGNWPDEAGVLAMGISLADATSLAAAFGQLAFVWCAVAEPPRLVWVAES